MFQKYFINHFFKNLEKMQHGTLTIITPENEQHRFVGSDDIEATLSVKDWVFIQNILFKGSIGLAESYRDGHLDVDNLVNLLIIVIRNEEVLTSYIYGTSLIDLASRIIYSFQANTIKGSKKNIRAHYDLGNDFYALWLDPSMTYSSALFKKKNQSLYDAQQNKYDRIINKIADNSSNILEIGCGWGGFAERALQKLNTNFKGVTISNQQYDFAKNKIDNHQNHNAQIVFQDYREVEGKYDAIVSIEMFEAIGEKFWPVYFNKIKSLLHQNGTAVIQAITISEEHFEQYRKSGDAIRSFIFPGGMLPSVNRFKQEVAQANLKTVDIFEFGADYVFTLKQWLDNFENCLPDVRKMGFDEKFIRIWRLYLALCISGFSEQRINVMQAEIRHG
ncbi:MAG: cyclopropane-fatty-acyl-phospholipid synthase family protein [Alphaproteobacteria bacterium]|nr:cyclopropane-fatty-acyl-phospholipid synthase family protein [Alphaproteobacteria bacterium]